MSKISRDPIPYDVIPQKKNYFFFFLLLLFTFNRCANPVTPTGGPKDVQPPETVKCDPPNFSTYFHAKEIIIEFDEFIQLKDASNQITISPPWLPNTDFKLRGKSIIIDFNDSLRSNTTYSFNFGNSISDITENNVLHDFIYVFSTGSYVDSLSLEGQIIDAFTLSPQKDVLAMLYVNDNDTIPFDSLPYKVKPYYLTRTNEKGEFRLINLSGAPFKMFALKDLNSDFMYNLPDEKIAFADSLIKGVYYAPVIPDTIQKDSLSLKDSLTIHPENKSLITLNLFQQYDSVQRIMKTNLIQDGQVGVYFRYPAKQPVFIPLNFTPSAEWNIEEMNRSHDTIILWLNNLSYDSLVLQVKDDGKIIDTVRLELVKKREKNKSEKKEGIQSKKLMMTTNIMGGYLIPFKKDLILTFSYPLTKYNFNSVSLVDGKDTVKPGIVLVDSVKRSVRLLHKWNEDKKYKVIIPDSTLYSINNLTNDSLIIDFKTRSARDYGSLKLTINFKGIPNQYIIQLLNEKDALIEQRTLTSSGKIEFSYLSATKYKIKAISDRNRNNRWDTGDYLNKLQPEKVSFFPKTIEIRANWEVEEVWDL